MRVLILNQAFYPDVVSTAQHASDLAVALAEAGDEVTVVASRRGYDDPAKRFSRSEHWRGVRIVRASGTRFGKRARWRRAMDFATYMAACLWKLLWLPRQDVVIAMTSPPLISFLAAALLVPWKARELVFWSMDLNPDEAIAAGWLRKNSLPARCFSWMLRYSLRRARAIIALDRFMAERIAAKGIAQSKIVVLPPWSHDDDVRLNPSTRERFREENGLAGKFVVMHSGNHSPCHPLTTLLDAATELASDPNIFFCFIGGGSEMENIRRTATDRRLHNVLYLPYQPREQLAASLSSADLHVVPMGDAFVGVIHPCKVYNVLALGMPILYIGPAVSHIAELLRTAEGEVRSYSCGHGDVCGIVEAIEQERRHAGLPNHRPRIAQQTSKQHLVPSFVQLIHHEDALRGETTARGSAGHERAAHSSG